MERKSQMADKKWRSLKFYSFILSLFFCSFSSVSSALDPRNCNEFKAIHPSQYDRNTSSASEKDKRPLGFMSGIAEYPTVQSEVENPCAVLKNLTGRYVEVLVQTLVPGQSICVRDDKTPNPNRDCQHGTISGCWNPARDTTAYEFYCDPGEGCDGDVQFWYRLTPSPVGKDVDDWCLGLQSEYPMDLVTAPPPVEKTTVVHSGSCKLHSCIVLVIFLLLQFTYSFILTL